MVSIIILVQDRYDFFFRCINSIQQHTKSDYELVLILQAVKDQRILDIVSDLEKSQGEQYRVITEYNEVNNGVTPGRNQGMKLATGDYLLFFDDDAYVSEDMAYLSDYDLAFNADWLYRMERYFYNSDRKVGIVGQSGSLINPKRKGIFWAADPGEYCDVVQGYCFMFSREVLHTIGYLDEFFGKFWHEESEYALRAKSKGFNVVSTGYIGVTHYGSGSGDDGTYGKKIDYLFNKWSPMFNQILEYSDECWLAGGLKANVKSTRNPQ